jgi:hypothetical protein
MIGYILVTLALSCYLNLVLTFPYDIKAKPFNNFFCIKVHVVENNSIFLNGGR